MSRITPPGPMPGPATTYVREIGSLESIAFSLGSGGDLSGAVTLASIFKVTDPTQVVQRNLIVVGSAATRWLLDAGVANSARLLLIRQTVAHLGGGPFLTNGWCVGVGTRAAGTSNSRVSIFNYATEAWDRANDGQTYPDSTPTTSCGVGSLTTASHPFQIAACAAWSVEMSDGDTEDLLSLSNWLGTSPEIMWVFDQADVNDDVLDLTGGGADETTHTGTTAVQVTAPPWLP